MKSKVVSILVGAAIAALLFVNVSMVLKSNAKGSLNLSSISSVFASGNGSGSGTEDDPYQLSGVEITCSAGSNGTCFYLDWKWCEDGNFFNYKCRFSGYQNDFCDPILETVCRKITI